MRAAAAAAFLALAALLGGGAAAAGAGMGAGTAAEWLGTFALPRDDQYLGGFSGVRFSPDGRDFILLSDRAALVAGRVTRDGRGAVSGVVFDPPRALADHGGQRLEMPYADSESLDHLAGRLIVGFEQLPRVAFLTADGRIDQTLPVPSAFVDLVGNESLEALAVAPDGAIYALPEGPAAGGTSIRVFRYGGGSWQVAFSIRQNRTFRPVDAAFGPDGALYLLERDFWPLLGFRSSLRRILFDDDRVLADRTLFESRAGRFGNLEGLGLWRAADGALHATLVADDNFLRLQDSTFVDFRLPPP